MVIGGGTEPPISYGHHSHGGPQEAKAYCKSHLNKVKPPFGGLGARREQKPTPNPMARANTAAKRNQGSQWHWPTRHGFPEPPARESTESPKVLDRCGNDPSAGSPTETLLRLHLPLNDKVWTSSRDKSPIKETHHNPEASPDHSIGRCDGRCVQRAGT